MNKKCLYAVSAVLFALSGIGTTANASTKRTARHYRPRVERISKKRTRNYHPRAKRTASFYGRYFVNTPAAIKTNTKTISGTASRGVRVILKSSANNKRVLSSTYASRRNGHYTLTIPAQYTRKNSRICVMARHGNFYPYRYVMVRANVTSAAKRNKRSKKFIIRKPAKKAKKAINRRRTRKPIKRSQRTSKRRYRSTKRIPRVKHHAKRSYRRTRRANRKNRRIVHSNRSYRKNQHKIIKK